MLTPEELLHITDGAEDIAESLHRDILDRIIERIMHRIGRGDGYILTAQDKWQLQVLEDAGFLMEDIQKEIAKYTGLMQTEVAEAMEDAGVRSLDYDNKIYEAAGLSPLPLDQSPALIRLAQRNYEATMGSWANFTQSMAHAGGLAYQMSCDKAYNLVMSGTVSYAQAVKEALSEIVKEGVTVQYYDPAGNPTRMDTIETATMRAVRTGISQATAQITDARMEEMDWDIILVSSHLGARVTGKGDFTDHASWQGKFYSKSGKDKRFPPYSVCGQGNVQGIHGANCRHTHGPGDGEHNPFENYDSEENQEAYKRQQRQRTLENRIRKTKRNVMSAQTARDSAKDDAVRAEFDREYQRKSALLARQNAEYNQFCKDNNVPKRNERIAIAQWNRSEAAKARAAAKKYAVDHPDSVVPRGYKPRPSKVTENKLVNPFSIEERKKKFSAIQASSIPDAIEIAKKKGIRYPMFEKMDVEQVNNMLNAVDTLPDDCKPAMIANGKNISTATGRPLGRKADQWWGVTYDYRAFSLRTTQLGYEKTDYDGGLLVGFNTTKFKKLDALTKAKEVNNEKYFAKTGRYWSFNTDGRATAYHEFGHCFVDVRGLPKNWESLSTKWAEESKCDILKKPEEAFAEAWAAFHMADERLPDYISDAIIEAIGGK